MLGRLWSQWLRCQGRLTRRLRLHSTTREGALMGVTLAPSVTSGTENLHFYMLLESYLDRLSEYRHFVYQDWFPRREGAWHGSCNWHKVQRINMNLDIQKIFYNLLIRSELPGQGISGEANMEAKTQVNLQGQVCDGRDIDPITYTGYGGFTCSMNCQYNVCNQVPW